MAKSLGTTLAKAPVPVLAAWAVSLSRDFMLFVEQKYEDHANNSRAHASPLLQAMDSVALMARVVAPAALGQLASE